MSCFFVLDYAMDFIGFSLGLEIYFQPGCNDVDCLFVLEHMIGPLDFFPGSGVHS